MVAMDRRDSPMYHHDWNRDGSILPQRRSPQVVAQSIRQHIHDATTEQARLARSRNELLTKRTRVQTLKKTVQAKRLEAGDAEALFMSHVQKSVNQGPDDRISSEDRVYMIKLYSRVESTRDSLGVLETDLQQAERVLAGAELRFKEEEDAFYEYDLQENLEQDLRNLDRLRLSTPLPAPPPPLPYSTPPVYPDGPGLFHVPPSPLPPVPPPVLPSAHLIVQPQPYIFRTFPVTPSTLPTLFRMPSDEDMQRLPEAQNSTFELGGLGRQFDTDRQALSESRPDQLTARFGVSEYPSPRPGTPLSYTIASETRSQSPSSVQCSDLCTEQIQHEYVPLKLYREQNVRRESDPLVYGRPNLVISQPTERSLSEKGASDMEHETDSKNRVHPWLFNLLGTNAIEKTVYQNILSQTLREHGFDFAEKQSWMIPAALFWEKDRSNDIGARDQEVVSNSSNDILPMADMIPTAKTLIKRRFSKVNIASKTIGSKATYLDDSREPDDHMDEPVDYPLPLSPIIPPSQIGSNLEAEDDDPSQFPLPPSPISRVSEPVGQNDTEGDDWYCVTLPPSPITTLMETKLVIHADDLQSAIRSATQTPALRSPSVEVKIPHDDDFLLAKETASEPTPRLSYISFMEEPGSPVRLQGDVDLSSSVFKSRVWRGFHQYAPKLNKGRSQSTGAISRPRPADNCEATSMRRQTTEMTERIRI